MSLFKLVVIDLEDNDDGQIIFEVLNGRQTPLAAADLVKNLLFLRADLSDDKDIDALYDTYWVPFDDPWWKLQVGTGHAARGRRDVLLSNWLTAVSGREVNVGHLYGEVRQHLNRVDPATIDVLSELSSYGAAYRVIYGVGDAGSAQLTVSYARLVRLGIVTALPLLLWLRNTPRDSLSIQQGSVKVV